MLYIIMLRGEIVLASRGRQTRCTSPMSVAWAVTDQFPCMMARNLDLHHFSAEKDDSNPTKTDDERRTAEL